MATDLEKTHSVRKVSSVSSCTGRLANLLTNFHLRQLVFIVRLKALVSYRVRSARIGLLPEELA